MLRAQDIKHIAKSGGATGQAIISIQKISTTKTLSGTGVVDGCDKLLVVVTIGSACGTLKCFLGTSDTVSGTFSGMTAITATTLSGLTVSNTVRAVVIDGLAVKKFFGVKLSNATALGYHSVHVFGIHNKTFPPRDVAAGTAATGFANLTVL